MVESCQFLAEFRWPLWGNNIVLSQNQHESEMSYIQFIKDHIKVINQFEQQGFNWGNTYDNAFINMISDKNPVFKSVLLDIPQTLNRIIVRDIFISEENLYKGFVACMLWGGINARRCAKGHPGDLTTTDAYKAFTHEKDQVEKKIKSVKGYLVQGNIASAFNSISNGHENHIPGIGISFFTKLLYFLAPENAIPRPLIYDKWSTYIHCALLIDNKQEDIHDYYTGVTKDGILRKAKPELDLYRHYLQLMKVTATANSINDVAQLEAFLFGFALNGAGHQEEKRRRRFLKNYVLNYFGPQNKTEKKNAMNKVTNKKTQPTDQPRIEPLTEGQKFLRRTGHTLSGYKITIGNRKLYIFTGENSRKCYCEVISSNGFYSDAEKKIMSDNGLEFNSRPQKDIDKYYICRFKVTDTFSAKDLTERIKEQFARLYNLN